MDARLCSSGAGDGAARRARIDHPVRRAGPAGAAAAIELPQAIPSGWIGIGGAPIVQTFVTALGERIALMSAAEIQSLVACGERLSRKPTRLQKHRIRGRVGEEIP